MAKQEFVKYQPQTPRNVLLNEISQNYREVSNYYQQRERNFQKILNEKSKKIINSFEEDISVKIEELWQQNINKFMEKLYWDSQKTVEQKVEEIKASLPVNSEWINDYVEAIKKSNYNLFRAKMGLNFEKFINSKIFEPYINEVLGIVNNQITSQITGAFTSTSSTTAGAKSIRPDLIISTDGIKFEKINGVQYGNKVSIETQRKLEINWEGVPLPSFDNELSSSDAGLFNQFLGEEGNFFGFSAKIYNAQSDEKRFSNSSIIQKALNEVFWYPYRTQGASQRHSWEIDYAEIYVIWNLSRILRTIISPTTIAMVYGDKLKWMHEFLQSKIFYMNISYQAQIKKHNAGEGRLFPSINSSAIYTKNFNIGKGINSLNTHIVNKRNYYNNTYYKGISIELS